MMNLSNIWFRQKMCMQETMKPQGGEKTWYTISLGEVKGFLSFIIRIGLVKNDIPDYWIYDYVHETHFFSKQMDRDMFLIILSNLHLVDNSKQLPKGQVGFDPLYKIMPLICKLFPAFSEVDSPERVLMRQPVHWKVA